jgi:hypothetical protein
VTDNAFSILECLRKCGFDLDGTTNFLSKIGFIDSDDIQEIDLQITDTAKSFNVYKLFKHYYDKDKLANLSELLAEHITVAVTNATGLYGADNQPSTSTSHHTRLRQI